MNKARRGKRSDVNPNGGRGGKAADKFVKTVESATYAEFNYFSERNPIWRRYITKAPRMPTDQDRTTMWTNTLFQPLLLNTFFGTQNRRVM